MTKPQLVKLRLCFMFYNRFKNGAAPILTQPLFCVIRLCHSYVLRIIAFLYGSYRKTGGSHIKLRHY